MGQGGLDLCSGRGGVERYKRSSGKGWGSSWNCGDGGLMREVYSTFCSCPAANAVWAFPGLKTYNECSGLGQ